MPLPNIKELFAGGASKLVDSVKGVISEFHISPEDSKKLEQSMLEITNKHIETMSALAQSEYEAQLKDVANARDSNVKIQESDKSSWLSKNVAYFIDIFVILIWGILTIYIIASALKIIKTTNVDLTGIYGLYATVTAVAMTIINFHRGSSRSSQDKDKQINTMINK